jgi:hypothetical protein
MLEQQQLMKKDVEAKLKQLSPQILEILCL